MLPFDYVIYIYVILILYNVKKPSIKSVDVSFEIIKYQF